MNILGQLFGKSITKFDIRVIYLTAWLACE